MITRNRKVGEEMRRGENTQSSRYIHRVSKSSGLMYTRIRVNALLSLFLLNEYPILHFAKWASYPPKGDNMR
jgi:hypothetical protein